MRQDEKEIMSRLYEKWEREDAIYSALDGKSLAMHSRLCTLIECDDNYYCHGEKKEEDHNVSPIVSDPYEVTQSLREKDYYEQKAEKSFRSHEEYLVTSKQ